MTPLEIIGLVVAAIAGAFAGLAKVYKFGPFLDNSEMPSLDREPEDLPFVPASPPPVMAPSAPKTPITAPMAQETIIDTTASKKPTIADFCACLKDYEGWILPGGKDWSGKVYPRGSQSYQNNNPGNCRFYNGGYLPKYLPVLKSKNNFAIFKDSDTGWLYLNEMVKNKVRLHPKQTLLQFMQGFAPVGDDNDPVAYTNFIAKRLSVTSDFLMGSLL